MARVVEAALRAVGPTVPAAPTPGAPPMVSMRAPSQGVEDAVVEEVLRALSRPAAG
jgi:hypothetical protein